LNAWEQERVAIIHEFERIVVPGAGRYPASFEQNLWPLRNIEVNLIPMSVQKDTGLRPSPQ